MIPTLSQFVVCVLPATPSSSEHGRGHGKLKTSLGVNHGGVAVIATPGVRLTSVDIGAKPSTFECVAARITSGPSSCVVAVLYRTGPVTASFFSELDDVLDRLSTFNDPLLLAGDVNIRLERTSDPHAVEFADLLAAYGLVQRVQGVTHDAGGTLDVVCTRDDLRETYVQALDVGLSDHRLFCWTSQLQRPPPVYTATARRSWRLFDSVPQRSAGVCAMRRAVVR